jgi:O-antigen ligase
MLCALAVAIAATILMNAWVGCMVLLAGLGIVAQPLRPFPAFVLTTAVATFVDNDTGGLTRQLSLVSAIWAYSILSTAPALASGRWRLARVPLTAALFALGLTTALATVHGVLVGNSLRYLGLELIPILCLFNALLVGGLELDERRRRAAYIVLAVVGLGHLGLGIYSYQINHVRTGGVFYTPVTGVMCLLTLSLALFDRASRVRPIMILLACAFLVHQLISFARGYWFGIVAAVPYLVAVYVRRGPGVGARARKAAVALGAMAALAGVGVVAIGLWFGWHDVASLFVTRFLSSVGTSASSETASNLERLVEYRAAWHAALAAPFFGYGLGYTLHIRQPVFNVVTTQWYVHETYLLVLLKQGIVGLAAYVAVLASAIAAGTRGALRNSGEVAGWSAGAGAATVYLAVIGLTNFSLSYVNSALLLGLLWGISLSAQRVPRLRITWRMSAAERERPGP